MLIATTEAPGIHFLTCLHLSFEEKKQLDWYVLAYHDRTLGTEFSVSFVNIECDIAVFTLFRLANMRYVIDNIFVCILNEVNGWLFTCRMFWKLQNECYDFWKIKHRTLSRSLYILGYGWHDYLFGFITVFVYKRLQRRSKCFWELCMMFVDYIHVCKHIKLNPLVFLR